MRVLGIVLGVLLLIFSLLCFLGSVFFLVIDYPAMKFTGLFTGTFNEIRAEINKLLDESMTVEEVELMPPGVYVLNGELKPYRDYKRVPFFQDLQASTYYWRLSYSPDLSCFKDTFQTSESSSETSADCNFQKVVSSCETSSYLILKDSTGEIPLYYPCKFYVKRKDTNFERIKEKLDLTDVIDSHDSMKLLQFGKLFKEDLPKYFKTFALEESFIVKIDIYAKREQGAIYVGDVEDDFPVFLSKTDINFYPLTDLSESKVRDLIAWKTHKDGTYKLSLYLIPKGAKAIVKGHYKLIRDRYPVMDLTDLPPDSGPTLILYTGDLKENLDLISSYFNGLVKTANTLMYGSICSLIFSILVAGASVVIILFALSKKEA